MQPILKRLPDAELEVMKALWDAGRPLTRPELDGALCGHRWAATTVLGLLSRLEGKGFLTRRRQGRGYLYAPARAAGRRIWRWRGARPWGGCLRAAPKTWWPPCTNVTR